MLRILAHHPRRSPEIFPLCRMLFEAKEGELFRRPALGGPWLVAHGSTPNWPLEPIAIFKGVPILVARGYTLLGHPESPPDYLEYCLKACKWREARYTPRSPHELQAIVEQFIAVTPAVAVDADWLRAQAK
jgi:hypothetical protein